MSTERHDASELDAKTDVAPGTGVGATEHTPHLGEFDREIDLRGVIWSGVGLVIVAIVSSLLMWWLLRGFASYDEKRDVRLTPIETASPQQPPPEPRLQISPNEEMRLMRERESHDLEHAGWVDRRQGIVRVPIDVAMEVIVSRGVSAARSASPPAPSPPQPSSPEGRGGSNTDSSQVPLSPSGSEGQGSEGQR
jgi:hypothetical protein